MCHFPPLQHRSNNLLNGRMQAGIDMDLREIPGAETR